MRLERTIASMAQAYEASVSYAPFLAAQIEVTRESVRAPGTRAQQEPAPMVTGAFLESAARILGLPVAEVWKDNCAATRVLVAATPYVRSLLVFPDLVRGVPARPIFGPERLPRVLGALYLLIILAQRAGMESVTFQTVGALFSRSSSLLYLLAHSDGVFVADRRGKGLDLAPLGFAALNKRYLRIGKALWVRAQVGSPRTLEEIITAHVRDHGARRARALNEIAARLKGGLEAVDARRRRRAWLEGWCLRTRIQTHLPEMLLRMVGNPVLARRALLGRGQAAGHANPVNRIQRIWRWCRGEMGQLP